MRPLLVRDGVDAKLPKGEHTFFNVYREMLYQVARDYSSIGDVRKLKISEIVFWYEGLRSEIREFTKPRK